MGFHAQSMEEKKSNHSILKVKVISVPGLLVDLKSMPELMELREDRDLGLVRVIAPGLQGEKP